MGFPKKNAWETINFIYLALAFSVILWSFENITWEVAKIMLDWSNSWIFSFTT